GEICSKENIGPSNNVDPRRSRSVCQIASTSSSSDGSNAGGGPGSTTIFSGTGRNRSITTEFREQDTRAHQGDRSNYERAPHQADIPLVTCGQSPPGKCANRLRAQLALPGGCLRGLSIPSLHNHSARGLTHRYQATVFLFSRLPRTLGIAAG